MTLTGAVGTVPAMPRKITTRINPATLSGLQRLIWDHEHTENDVEKVKAARKVSNAFIEAGGCGWCWSELHVHGTCGVINVNTQHD